MMEPASRIPKGLIDPLILEIYIHQGGNYEFYEDQNMSLFSSNTDKHKLSFRWRGSPARTLLLRFVGVSQAEHIVVEYENGISKPIEDWHLTGNNTLEVRVPVTGDGRLIVDLPHGD
jgi:hypothetical protein